LLSLLTFLVDRIGDSGVLALGALELQNEIRAFYNSAKAGAKKAPDDSGA